MKMYYKFLMILLLLFVVAGLFMFYDVGANSNYVLSKRGIRLASMLVVGISVAFSSVIFQTLTNNRILTPSIMGYEAIFILFQTIIVFLYGDKAFKVISQQENFFYAVLLMLVFSVVMYLLMFGKQKRGMFYLLLTGMVMGTLFQTLSQFMHVLIDPNEFSIVQNFMFVSFAKMNTKLLSMASITMLLTIVYALYHARYLDVIALGREHAINLGLDYNKLVRRFMLVISLLVSVSTALVGPITFLGILVTNLTYELFTTRKHRWMLWICSVIACLCLVLGQFLVEHVLRFSTTVSIVINFIGGVYFMYLIWISRKKVS
ncbi:iron chelate uptake ABC transporter family permease subunit [Sphingobacterium bambusae]|uniref:Iron chelate uptake ABC transporter family permease subunit n=1 Tax=Sphingobacterium bambusae TaxID=662858 RepID=A0ABW6BFZ2_9SPHI|nr:iron chelate uptake ABC transporter family permease subunit [Sphingobacterium bambusae]WPL47550.1 iron chelate uptake ABC transporter family permease subunit [Sphingobacterium bambusae]